MKNTGLECDPDAKAFTLDYDHWNKMVKVHSIFLLFVDAYTLINLDLMFSCYVLSFKRTRSCESFSSNSYSSRKSWITCSSAIAQLARIVSSNRWRTYPKLGRIPDKIDHDMQSESWNRLTPPYPQREPIWWTS